MNTNLQFDFIVDKEKNTITVVREFAAEQQLVWDAYTKSELLEQWFAPKPWKAETKTMDFSEGGAWLYAMVSPEGGKHWGRMDYEEIRPIEYYKGLDGFCDADGNLNPDLPRSVWTVDFKAHATENTLVHNVVAYKSLEDLETVIKMGMKEGLTMALEGLDELLASLTNNK